MDSIIEGNQSPKRKLEQTAENEPPDKKHCSEIDTDFSSNKNNEPCLVKVVCIDTMEMNEGTDEINDHDTIDSNSVQCSNTDINERIQELEPSLDKQSIKEFDLKATSNITIERGDNNQSVKDYSSTQLEPIQQSIDAHIENLNIDNIENSVNEVKNNIDQEFNDCSSTDPKPLQQNADANVPIVNSNTVINNNKIKDSCDQQSNDNVNSEPTQQNVDINAADTNTDSTSQASNINNKIKDSSDQQSNDDNVNSEPTQQNVNINAADANTDSTSQASNINVQPVPKEKCKYGSQCYRRNAEHKATFSHPGDADYDIPDNRPECPYGMQCYRKNQQHKLDYKHTHSKRKRTSPFNPLPPLELSDLDSTDESVDESDYDASFIDDESLEEFESDFEDEDE